MAQELLMPQLGLTMEEGTVETWLKKEGDKISVGDEILEISTDKLVNVIESEYEGILLKIVAQEGEDVQVKGLLAIIGEEGEVIESSSDAKERTSEPIVSKEDTQAVTVQPLVGMSTQGQAARTVSGRIKISPLAKKTADKLSVDYVDIVGSGPGGRIRQMDILAVAENSSPVLVKEEEVVPKTPITEKISQIDLEEGDIIEKLSSMRKVIAERMTKSAQEIPAVTQDVEVNMNKLLAFRRQVNIEREKRISINDFIVKAVSNALLSFPSINSSLIDGQFVKRANVNIGVAVSTDNGLIVPVVKKAQLKSLSAISEEVKDLSTRAREGGLQAQEYSGSTFTISNLGMFGVTSFTPIINQPNVAILGVNAIKKVLALDEEGNVVENNILTLSLTYDHRIIDGSEAAKFENRITELLEDPLNIIL